MIEKRQALDASTKQELDLALRQKVLTFLSSYNHIALFVGKQDEIDR